MVKEWATTEPLYIVETEMNSLLLISMCDQQRILI